MTTSTTLDPRDVRIVPEWELCDRLRRSLRLVPLDNAEVADLMGVRRETVSTWLGGRRKPNRATLMIWADMTGVQLDWLEHGHVDELRARRDSNPKPSDPEPVRVAERRMLALVHSSEFVQDSVNRGFTPNLRTVS